MSELIVSAHQPNFMPYLGFFDKMKKSDIFVIRDEVLFTDSDYHHRNRIRINGNDNLNSPQYKWINVPVEKVNDYIMHVNVKKDAVIKNRNWKNMILHDLESNYRTSPSFQQVFPKIKNVLEKNHDKLIHINMDIIELFRELLEVDSKIVFASSLNLKPSHFEKGNASEDLARICKSLGADVYLSGEGGRNYLNIGEFEKYGLEVRFQEFKHPKYAQNYPGFLSNMSAIDYLFCNGKSKVNESKSKFELVEKNETYN